MPGFAVSSISFPVVPILVGDFDKKTGVIIFQYRTGIFLFDQADK